MKNKIKLRIERKKKAMPTHSLDTCIFMSYLIGDREFRVCEKYLARIGSIYGGFISLLVYGELLNKILEKHKERYLDILLTLRIILEEGEFQFYVPEKRSHILYREIRSIDSRIENLDAFILASAIENKIDVFVTTDIDLVGHPNIEKRFNIRIKHPEELI